MGNLFAEAKLKTALANDTYTDKKEIVSKAGYLLGVDKNIFDSGELLPEIYEELEKNQDARMVRNLCFLFTCIEHCYKQLQMQMVNDLKNLHSMDMTKAATEALRKDGLDIVKANCTLDEYRPRIAAEIANRIQGCKDIFPMWVPWEYIRQMFSFPTKTKDRAQERAWLYYNENIIRFPYNVFLNWQFKADEGGNLLGSDEQFLIRLYAQNGDTFCDYDKVRGESKQTQQNVEQFLLHSVRSEILVDCENCDPLKFFAVLQSLSPEAIGKIQKIFLFDDVNASSIWGLVEHYTKAKVDRFMTQRVVEGKSVVDMTVAVCCCQEHYDKKIDSFLLFSSDSDYWPLINNVVTARFLMMFEREKTSKAIVNKMREHHVLYCYTDQFCKAGDAYRLRNDALALECASYLKQQLGSCNIEDIHDLAPKYQTYFGRDGRRVEFTYNDISFEIRVARVFVFPQGVAAIAPYMGQIMARPEAYTYIIDIGGYTTDVVKFSRGGQVDMTFCESFNNGVIKMYDEVQRAVRNRFQLDMDDYSIDNVLRRGYNPGREINELVHSTARSYARTLIRTLKEKGVDLTLSYPVFIGGGSCLMRPVIESELGRDDYLFVEDPRANAVGFKMMAESKLAAENR